MPSLKDLAKECGVSVATVSKALNDQPDIAAATRERIRAVSSKERHPPQLSRCWEMYTKYPIRQMPLCPVFGVRIQLA